MKGTAFLSFTHKQGAVVAESLVADFLLLPALLILIDGKKKTGSIPDAVLAAN